MRCPVLFPWTLQMKLYGRQPEGPTIRLLLMAQGRSIDEKERYSTGSGRHRKQATGTLEI